MEFTKKQISRYSRQIVLKKVGVIGQKKLFKSNILIIGAGGLGSPIAFYLAAMGIGKIGIVDKDKVEVSNLSRQIIFSNNDIGKSKSLIAIKKISKINPDIKVLSSFKLLVPKPKFPTYLSSLFASVLIKENWVKKFPSSNFFNSLTPRILKSGL